VVEILERCKKGTAEWRDALTNVNASVADLIREYPELLSMVDDKGNSVIYKDAETGSLRVSDYGREEILRRNN